MSKYENNEEQSNACSSEIKKSCHGKYIIIPLLLISLVANLGSLYLLSIRGIASTSNSPEKIANAVMEKYLSNEYKKAGSQESYELLAKAQQLQMEDQIPQIKQFIASKAGGTTNVTKGTETPAVTKTLTQDEITAIKNNAYIEGNKEALMTLVEYSDLECPFCIRQYKEGTIEKVRQKFGDKVNSIFKSFRGVPHENSETEANALLCAGDIGGTKSYVAYYNAIFTRTNGGNGTGFSKDALLPLAQELKINSKKFQSCVDSKENIKRFDAETAEGAKLGVQGTPGTVVINNQTGEYELIAGAYPVTEFERVINKLLGTK
ncbi:MAG: thioredoxin domain-containing protein [Candidatus Gracilibacteria bacterium]|jgi:protein-disulfide isomerase